MQPFADSKPRVVSLNRLWDEEGYQIAVSERENYIDLYDAILSLKDIYRIPVILKYLHGFTERETADILGLNQNTVKTRLLKARDMLRKSWGPMKGGLYMDTRDMDKRIKQALDEGTVVRPEDREEVWNSIEKELFKDKKRGTPFR